MGVSPQHVSFPCLYSSRCPPLAPRTIGHGHSHRVVFVTRSWYFFFKIGSLLVCEAKRGPKLKGAMAGADNFVRKLKDLSPTSVSIQSLSKW